MQTSNSRCRESSSNSADKKQDNIPVSLYQTHTLHPPWIPAAISTCLEWIMTVTIHLLSRYRDTPPAAIHSYTMRKRDVTTVSVMSEREHLGLFHSSGFSLVRFHLMNSVERFRLVSAGFIFLLLNIVHVVWNYRLFRLIMADRVLFDNLIWTYFISWLNWFHLFCSSRLFDVMLWDNIYSPVYYNDIMILLIVLIKMSKHTNLSFANILSNTMRIQTCDIYMHSWATESKQT